MKKTCVEKLLHDNGLKDIFCQGSTVSLIPLTACGLRLRDTLGSTAIKDLETTIDPALDNDLIQKFFRKTREYLAAYT